MTAEYGEYLTNVGDCRACHGAQLSGAQPVEPGAPFAPNLTPGGELAGWSESDFINTLRTGVTPSGQQLSDFTPWRDAAKMTDDELKAMWLYLQAQPKLATVIK